MGSSSKQNFSAKLVASKPWGAFKKADTWVLVSEFLIQCSGLGPGNQKKNIQGIQVFIAYFGKHFVVDCPHKTFILI